MAHTPSVIVHTASCLFCLLLFVSVKGAFKEFLCLGNVTNIDFYMILLFLIPYNANNVLIV